MKVLVFDADASTSAIGGEQAVKQKLGFPPVRVNGGLDQLDGLIDRITDRKTVTLEHDLFGDTTKETVLDLSDKARGIGLDAIVIDSLSVIGYQTRLALMRANGAIEMDLRLWGQYGDKMMRFIHKMSRLACPVICTAHVDRDRDENGGPIEIPAFKGGSKLEAARFFDVIAYADIKRGRKGEANYIWQIIGDGRRSQAKSRMPFPTETGIIDQDFGPLLKHYFDQGHYSPKIMVIGDSGRGKTTSLATLADVNISVSATNGHVTEEA